MSILPRPCDTSDEELSRALATAMKESLDRGGLLDGAMELVDLDKIALIHAALWAVEAEGGDLDLLADGDVVSLEDSNLQEFIAAAIPEALDRGILQSSFCQLGRDIAQSTIEQLEDWMTRYQPDSLSG